MIEEFRFAFNFEKKLCEFRLNDYKNGITFYHSVLFNENEKIFNIEQVGDIAVQSFTPFYEPKYILNVIGYSGKVVAFEIKEIDYFKKRIIAEKIDTKSIEDISDRFNKIISQEVLIRKDIPSNKVGADGSIIEVLLRQFALAHF